MDVTSVRFAFTLISSVAAFMGASACFMDFILLFIFLQVFFSSSKSLLFAWNTSRVVCCLCAIYLFRLCCCCFFSHALSIFFCCCITFCLNVSLSLALNSAVIAVDRCSQCCWRFPLFLHNCVLVILVLLHTFLFRYNFCLPFYFAFALLLVCIQFFFISQRKNSAANYWAAAWNCSFESNW